MAITHSAEYEAMTEMIMSIMGVDRFAYVKSVKNEDEPDDSSYAVHAADGTRLAVFHCRDEAFKSIKRHNLTPVNVH